MKKSLLTLGAIALFAFSAAGLRAAQKDWTPSLDTALTGAKASQTLVFAEFHSDT
jgi:hypothetical protein